ncbi:hypothetical protein GCM10027341_18070 [Spirosoma knui]
MLYNILRHAHSGLRWLVLILLIAAAVTAIQRLRGRNTYTDGNRKLYLFALIATHIQFLGGLLLYVLPVSAGGSPKVNFDLAMDKFYRFYTVEHITTMLIAIILVTIGYSRHKRLNDATDKHRMVALFYGLGLLLILIAIPWPFRMEGASWF